MDKCLIKIKVAEGDIKKNVLKSHKKGDKNLMHCTACGTNSWSQPSESIIQKKKKLLSTKMWVKCIKKSDGRRSQIMNKVFW